MLHDIVFIWSKKKEVILQKIFKHWVSITGSPKKILVDNGGKFANSDFLTVCENFNIRICATTTESPWSNGLIKWLNAVLGLMAIITITKTNCNLETAFGWGVSVKNSLSNNNGFLTDQLVFNKNPNYPTIEMDQK